MQYISVKNQLPELNKTVLVLSRKFDYPYPGRLYHQYSTEKPNGGYQWLIDLPVMNKGHALEMKVFNVTHWCEMLTCPRLEAIAKMHINEKRWRVKEIMNFLQKVEILHPGFDASQIDNLNDMSCNKILFYHEKTFLRRQ